MQPEKEDNNTLKQLRNRFQNSDLIKLVIGAGDVWHGHEWIATNEEDLDILDEECWAFFFKDRKADLIVAEHVWEHFTPEQALVGLRNIYKFLSNTGNFRLAVPDGLFPSEVYIDQVRPGGIGAGADDHKVLYTYKTMSNLLDRVPFRITLLEYWDQRGKFHFIPYDAREGMIRRSYLYDERNSTDEINYTSLIVDCKK